MVNGREQATLVASPYQFDCLVDRFLRLQGCVSGLDYILSLGICADSGLADILIRGDLREPP